MAEDRSGIGFGNGDMIMVLLSQQPEKPWNQIMMREALKLTEDEFETALAALTKDKWVTRDPTTNSMTPTDRVGSGADNGYWAGDGPRYEAAAHATEKVSGISTSGANR